MTEQKTNTSSRRKTTPTDLALRDEFLIQLSNYEQRFAEMLAVCEDLSEVKRLGDQAETAKAYAKKIGLDLRVINRLTSLKGDTQRALGRLSDALPQAPHTNKSTSSQEGATTILSSKGAVLADAGISRVTATRCESIADIPEEKWIELKDKMAEDESREWSSKDLYRIGQTYQRAEKKRAELNAKPQTVSNPGEQLWDIRQGDCLEILESLQEKARLIFADPPYNIGVDYGKHYNDARPADEFQRWCQQWLAACHKALADDGSLWLLINHEWAWVLCYEAIETTGFRLRQWITWYESFGVNTTKMFNRCSRPLLWLTKDSKRFVFNSEAPEIRRQSDRQAIYDDKRADPDGKLWDDVWGINPSIPRITGTSKERLPDVPTQLPLALLRPIVACASNAGDLVIDPFSGSGTTGAACVELGRRFIGCELSKPFAEISRLRLAGVEAKHDVR